MKQLALSGCKVAALGRRLERLQVLESQYKGNVLPYSHDVTNYGEVPVLFQQITKELGGLDLIVYSSGVMPAVGPDEYDFEKDKSIIEVNLLGAVAWLNQAAIRFGNAGHGTIVAIGSVAGERGRGKQPVYNASKAALATYMEALRNRLAVKGVSVVTVKPGPVDTDMSKDVNRKKLPVTKAAQLILSKSARSGEHFLLLPEKVLFTIIRNIPSPLFRKLNALQ